MGFDDPPRLAAGASTEEERLAPYRRVRDEIRDFVQGLPESLPSPPKEPEEQIQQHRQPDADDDAGRDGEMEGPAFAPHPNVAGQTAQGQAEGFDQPDHGPCHDQHHAENQNPFADHRAAAFTTRPPAFATASPIA